MMFTASNISKTFKGRNVLDEVSLSLAPGASAVIVGRNGAGKSTLLSIFSGFLKPDSGEVKSEPVAYCPQFDDLFEDLTVGDNIKFWAKAHKSGENDITDYVSNVLGVNDYINKRVSVLSGGMKKSTAITCALTGGERVLILDEPFASLDIFYKGELLKVMKMLLSKGYCIIYTAHGTDEIHGLGSDVYSLSDGKLVRCYDGNY